MPDTKQYMDLLSVRGVGEKAVALLKKVGIFSAQDLIENVPREYTDYSHVAKVRNIVPGTVTLRVKLHSVKGRYSKKGLHITEALASDETGSVRVMWFNQPYRAQSLKSDEEYFISGEFATSYKYLVINNPSCELVSDFPLHTARLVPKYRLTKGLTAHQLRKYTKNAFELIQFKELLPEWLIAAHQLMDRRSALLSMHFPDDIDTLTRAKQRIAFDEVFEMVLASELNKREYAQVSAVSVPFNKAAVQQFVQSLPYKLTDHQRAAAWSVLQDMTVGHPMNRLVEGDVGSGKTVVAAIAAVNVAAGGMQTALMAPTELLASQHAQTLSKVLPSELVDSVVFLSGSMTRAQKQHAREAIENGAAKVVVGTHALFQSDVTFKNLGLAIIDEQHRFGVEQRKRLQAKAITMPHVLHMTATPIPRSLMLTLYGEMDVSIIAQKPPGRSEVKTVILEPEQRQKLYVGLEERLKSGEQAFVVCPQIEEEELKTGRSLSVNAIHAQVGKWCKSVRVGLLHGKLKADEKERIMQEFIDKKLEMLVSTTVIEVGVDVPNATVMVIEGADRFGLAQIHQLRGRVGRGDLPGFCYLIQVENGNPNKRLTLLQKESDGFKLAEYDLDMRGPGAIYGTVQHGALDLRVAKITDVELIKKARDSAKEFIDRGENLVHYPQLKERVDLLRTITNLN